MMRKVLLGVVLLLGICPTVLTVTFECLLNDAIKVTTTDGEMTDWYVLVAETGCSSYQQLTGTGGQTVTWSDACFDYSLGTSFSVLMSSANTGFINDGDDMDLYDVTCTADTGVTATASSVSVTPGSATSESDELTAIVTLTLDSAVYAVGESVTGTINFGAGYGAEYVMGLQEVDLTVDGNSLKVFASGCPASPPLSAALSGDSDSATSLTITFDAPYSMGSGSTSTGTQTLGVKVTLNLCVQGGTTTACYDASACTARRRKREAGSTNNILSKSAQAVAAVLPSNASVDEYNRNMYDMLAAIYEPAKDEEMCVDKTVSAVVLVLLLVGMILCLMATLSMFFKLRKSRKLVNPETYEYSNKSFKR